MHILLSHCCMQSLIAEESIQTSPMRKTLVSKVKLYACQMLRFSCMRLFPGNNALLRAWCFPNPGKSFAQARTAHCGIAEACPGACACNEIVAHDKTCKRITFLQFLISFFKRPRSLQCCIQLASACPILLGICCGRMHQADQVLGLLQS